MEGQLSQNPLAELIREIIDSEISGALRLSREVAKVAVYFDAGKPVFAASNLRAHRLREALKRSGFANTMFESIAAMVSDEDLAKALTESGELQAEELQKIRATQAYDVLRTALLWVDGSWQFDQRVRIPKEMRATLDLDRLLLESARHLPFEYVKGRVADANAGYSLGTRTESIKLLPAEASVLAQAEKAGEVFRLADLSANGISEEDYLRGVYALSLSGILRRQVWDYALKIRRKEKSKAKPLPEKAKPAAVNEAQDVEAFLARVKASKDHYEVLDVSKIATLDEIKDAYHTLARQYHPDRFHQVDAELRNQIGSAFARIAQAYEILSDGAQRGTYDKKREPRSTGQPSQKLASKSNVAPPPPEKKSDSRAETSFRRGMEAMDRSEFEEACRFLGEAATIEPREARYRAHYGRALTFRANSRRIAETELQAALAIEPNNGAFRVMLAELYQRVGLRRRAESEAARALVAEPNNRAARKLLASLKNK